MEYFSIIRKKYVFLGHFCSIIFLGEYMTKSIKCMVIIDTIKIVLASMTAILLAEFLNLQYAVSAGIIAILSIQPTKKETMKTALGRFLAFVCALLISSVSFYLAGFTVTAFVLYLFVFIFICLSFGWNHAMAMDSVLISHFLTSGNMEFAMIGNETLLFVIGVGAGIIANLHLHKDVRQMEELRERIDNQIKNILFQMSERILGSDNSDYNGKCFDVLSEYLGKARRMAEQNYKNQLSGGDVFDMKYVGMRREQYECLYEMYKNVRKIKTTPAQAQIISDFLKQISEEYHKENTVDSLLNRFYEIDQGMRTQPLPVERREFEDRAMLYSLLRHLEEFLMIKKEFAKKYL